MPALLPALRALLAALLPAALLLLLLAAPRASHAQRTLSARRSLPFGGAGGAGARRSAAQRGARPSLVVVSTLDGAVVGYDAATGATLFAVRADAPALDSWARAGSPEYIPTLDGALYRLDPATGEAVSVDPRFIAPAAGGARAPVLARGAPPPPPAAGGAGGAGAGAVVLTAQKTAALYVNLRTGAVVRSVSFSGGRDGLRHDVLGDAPPAGLPGDDIVLLSQTTMAVRVVDAASAEELANATLTHTNPSFLARGQCIVAASDGAAHAFSASVSEDRSRIVVRGSEGAVVWEKKVDSAVVEAHGMGSVAVASTGELEGKRPELPQGDPARELGHADETSVALVVAREGNHRYMKKIKKAERVQKYEDSDAMVYKVREPRPSGGLGVARPHIESEPTDGLALMFSFVVVICLMAGYAMGRRPRRRARFAEQTSSISAPANRERTPYASFEQLPSGNVSSNDESSIPEDERRAWNPRSPAQSAKMHTSAKFGNDEVQLSSTESTGSRSSGGVVSNRTKKGDMVVGCLEVSSNLLGVGSHGTFVYEGKMNPGGRKVAVKRLLRQFFESARKEITLLVQLDEASPYVVRYFAMEEDSEFIYLALELCAGTLGERVTGYISPAPPAAYVRGPAPVATVRALRQLFQGLAGLHRAGVVHRDLKPQNVLLSRTTGTNGCADIKLADVGLAMRLAANRSSYTALSNAGGGVGTTGWRAPEVLRGGRQTKAVDIFSAGCIVGFVLTGGKHPFGTAVFGRDGNIASNRPVLEPLEALELPEAVDIVKKMIHPDCTQRPTADAALCHPFFWTDAMKLSFLVDISDRLYDLRNEPARYTENLDRSAIAVAHCNDWIIQMDMELLSGLGRAYDGTATGLLRVIRNKKNHYSELPSDLQKLLGRLPEDESSDGSVETDENGLHAHNFLTYFTSRVPHLLMCAYEYALENPALIEQPHFTRYGFKTVTMRESPALHPRVRRLQLDRMGEALDVDAQVFEPEEPETPSRRLYQRYQLVELQKVTRPLSKELKQRLIQCEMYSEDSAARWTQRLATGIYEPIESGKPFEDEDDSLVGSTATNGLRVPMAAGPPGFDRTPRFRPSSGFAGGMHSAVPRPSPSRPSPGRPSPGRPSPGRPSPGRMGPPGFATAAGSEHETPFTLQSSLGQGGTPPFSSTQGYRSIASVGNRRARMSGQAPPPNNNTNNGEQRVIDFGTLRRK